MHSQNAFITTGHFFDFKRGSIQVFDFADTSIIGTEKAYSEVFNFIKDFSEIIKSSKDIHLEKSSADLCSILRKNKIPLKDLYNRLFFNWFSTETSKNIAKNRNKFMLRTFSILTMPFKMISFPLNYYEFSRKYNDESFDGYVFRDKYDNFKKNRAFTLKMIMYLMILIRCSMLTPLEITYINTFITKSPYGDLFDYIEKKGAYSDYLNILSKELERVSEREFKYISSEFNKLEEMRNKESDKINGLFEKLNNSIPIDEVDETI